jgi:integrase
MIARRSVVTIYVRHQGSCRYVSRQGRSFARDCDCVKWLRYSGDACFCQGRRHGLHRQHKLTTGSRSWEIAEEKRAELQRRLDAGELTPLPQTPDTRRPTIEQCIETYVKAKASEGRTAPTIQKLRHQLGLFQQFLNDRSKFFPPEITAADLIEFRAGWNETWASSLTRRKAQTNLRGFLRSCCKENLVDLLNALKTIKLTKEDQNRLKPKPFTEDELKRLLAQVPKAVSNPNKATKMTTLIRFMVSTGLAIRDTVQLRREDIQDGWLRIERQKTGRPVKQKLHPDLHRELLTAANSNPKYIFWNGRSLPTSAATTWLKDLKPVMEAAGVWIRGNLSHRFRDTAVDFWIGQGWSIVDIATALGDTIPVVEAHYRDQLSKRQEARLAELPTRSWR